MPSKSMIEGQTAQAAPRTVCIEKKDHKRRQEGYSTKTNIMTIYYKVKTVSSHN